MSDGPLRPFPGPSVLFTQLHLPSTFSSGELIVWVLYAVFAFWAVYTIVAIYHWVTYSHASSIAFPAIIVHIFLSFILIAYALGIIL